MVANELKKLVVLNNPIDAELLRGLLVTQGIQVMLSKEGAATAYGLTAGAFSEIEVFVPQSQAAQAMEIVNEYFHTEGGEQEED